MAGPGLTVVQPKVCDRQSVYDDNMKWEKDGSSVEIRTQGELIDGRPALDEIVASGATVHLEQMSHDHWWMGLEAGGKSPGEGESRLRRSRARSKYDPPRGAEAASGLLR